MKLLATLLFLMSTSSAVAMPLLEPQQENLFANPLASLQQVQPILSKTHTVDMREVPQLKPFKEDTAMTALKAKQILAVFETRSN